MKTTSPIKKCQRCGNRVLDRQAKCDECGLVFARLDDAKNCYARKELLHGHRENVIFVRKVPSDISKLKLSLLCGFLGLFGAHNFYIGRYFKAMYMLIIGLVSLIFASLTEYPAFYEKFMSFFFILPALLLLFWVSDFVEILFNKYKIPVALERKE